MDEITFFSHRKELLRYLRMPNDEPLRYQGLFEYFADKIPIPEEEIKEFKALIENIDKIEVQTEFERLTTKWMIRFMKVLQNEHR